jgi:nucleoside-diphosphate-sugar epimerase
MSKRISIIGAGWLGLPLAQSLQKKQGNVFATTTREEKLRLLSAAGISPIKLIFDQHNPRTIVGLPAETEILIITLPPTLGRQAPIEKYRDIIHHLLNEATNLSYLKKIIFTSSTSVYGNAKGILTEEISIQPQTIQENILAEVETILLEKRDRHLIYILRLGGLVGPGREPARFFKDRKEIPGGEIAVNLVHRDDCQQIIEKLIYNDIAGGIYNITADKHPARGIFYPQRAKLIGFEEPTFLWGNEPERYVSNEKIKKELGYTFVYPDPLFFPSCD